MLQSFSPYPNKRRWLLAHPDSNIDHRRVPNLMVFFARKAETLLRSNRAEDYSPGDLVTGTSAEECRTSGSWLIRSPDGAGGS